METVRTWGVWRFESQPCLYGKAINGHRGEIASLIKQTLIEHSKWQHQRWTKQNSWPQWAHSPIKEIITVNNNYQKEKSFPQWYMMHEQGTLITKEGT